MLCSLVLNTIIELTINLIVNVKNIITVIWYITLINFDFL